MDIHSALLEMSLVAPTGSTNFDCNHGTVKYVPEARADTSKPANKGNAAVRV